MDLVKLAEQIAREAHGDQPRKFSDDLYIVHPQRVARKMDSVDEKVVAWLHDVIEDTKLDGINLLERGIPAHLVEAVEAISKLPGEDYLEYLLRVRNNPIARAVKIADLEDNIGDHEKGTLLAKHKLAHYLLNLWVVIETLGELRGGIK